MNNKERKLMTEKNTLNVLLLLLLLRVLPDGKFFDMSKLRSPSAPITAYSFSAHLVFFSMSTGFIFFQDLAGVPSSVPS